MHILLDENLPRKLKEELPGHRVVTVQAHGWSSTKNGELLRLAAREFDVFMTSDQNLPFQQNVALLDLRILILVTHDIRFQALKLLMPEVRAVLPTLQPGLVAYVPIARRPPSIS